VYRRRRIHRKIYSKEDELVEDQSKPEGNPVVPEVEHKLAENEYMRRLSVLTRYDSDHHQSMASARESPTFGAVLPAKLEPPPALLLPARNIRKVVSKRAVKLEVVEEDENSALRPGSANTRPKARLQAGPNLAILGVINEELYAEARKEAFQKPSM
jgi:hypothetical protein